MLSCPLSKTMGAGTIAHIEWVTQGEIQRKTQVPADGYEITEKEKKYRNILLELGTQSLSRLLKNIYLLSF